MLPLPAPASSVQLHTILCSSTVVARSAGCGRSAACNIQKPIHTVHIRVHSVGFLGVGTRTYLAFTSHVFLIIINLPI